MKPSQNQVIEEILQILKTDIGNLGGAALWGKAQGLPPELKPILEQICANKNRQHKQMEKVYEFEDRFGKESEEYKTQLEYLNKIQYELENERITALNVFEKYISNKPLLPITAETAKPAESGKTLDDIATLDDLEKSFSEFKQKTNAEFDRYEKRIKELEKTYNAKTKSKGDA